MTAEHWWVVVHLAGTGAMVGFIWTIQLLSYPMMAAVPARDFPAYEAEHTRRVTWTLAVLAPVEVVAAAGVALFVPAVPSWLSIGAGGVLVAIWVSTGVYYAPVHGRLSDGFDAALHRRLVATNWLRTVAWTGRGAAAIAMVAVAT